MIIRRQRLIQQVFSVPIVCQALTGNVIYHKQNSCIYRGLFLSSDQWLANILGKKSDSKHHNQSVLSCSTKATMCK